jgi:hypothetical protein
MRVQTDRYNWSVPVPLDSAYAVALVIAAGVLLIAAVYYSGAHRDALSANPRRLFSAVVAAAARRGEGTFWLVWALIALGAVLAFGAIIIFIGLVAWPT